MRRQERRRRAREAQPLVPRLARLLGDQRAGRLHPPKHRALPRDRLVAIAERVVAGRPLRQAGEKRRLRRRQHRRLGAEVGAARPAGADDLIAVGREIQIERENLALVEAMLEPQREHGLADLLAHAPDPLRRPAVEQQLRDLLRDRRAALDDLAFDRFCRSARAIATGSTPGCDQKRRSSAAIVAATRLGGRLCGSRCTLRVPSPDSDS